MKIDPAELALTLFEEAGDALFLFDPDDERVLDANPMAQRLTGCTRQELLKYPITYLFRSEAPQGMQRLRHAFKRTGAFHSQEGYLLRQPQDGTWIPVNLTISRLHAEPRTLGLVTARDVREQRETWQQLRKTEAELRQIVNSVNCYLWAALMHPDGRWELTYISPNVEQFTGRPPSYFFGPQPQRWLDILHPEDRAWIVEHVRRQFESRNTRSDCEYRVVLPDGTSRWLQDSARFQYDPDGTIRMHGVVTDVSERRRAEQESKRLAEHLRAIIETTPDCVKLIACDGTVLDMNNTGLKMIGAKSLEEVRGRKVEEFVLPQYQGPCRDFIRRVCSGQRLHGEFEVCTLTGEHRWMECRGVPLTLPGDTSALALTISTDITERRRVEQALRESEEKYRTLVETTDDVIWSVDAQGIFTFVNAQGVRRIFGYEPHDLIGQHFSVLFPPGEVQRLQYIFLNDLRKHGRVSGLECEARARDGRRVHLSLNTVALFDERGKYKGALGTCLDITALKQTEDELRRSMESHRRLIQNSLAGFFRSTMEGKILDCNDALVEILGGTCREEILGTPISSFIPSPEDEKIAIQIMEVIRAQGFVKNYEARRKRFDGRIIWVLHNVVRVQDEEGNEFLEGTVIDITDRKQAEEALTEQAAQFSLQAEVSVALGLAGDVPTALQRCVEAIQKNLRVESVCLWIPKERSADLELKARAGPLQGGYQERAYRLGEGLIGRVANNLLPEIYDECPPAVLEQLAPVSADYERLSWLIYPLVIEDRLIGVLDVISARRPSGNLMSAIETVAEVMAQWFDRKRAEEALVASEAKYRALVDNLEQCVFLKDKQLRYVAVNRQTCQVLGRSEDELIGKTDFDLYPAALAEKYRQDDLLVIREGRRIEREEETQVQGKRRIMRVVKTPLRNAQGDIEGVLSISWDVSEQRALEEQLRQAQKMEAVGQLAGGIAHDFNNLLQGILGNISLVLSALPESDPNRPLLQSADKAATRASELVRNLLSFSRRGELHLESVSVNAIVQEMLEILRPKVPGNVTLRLELQPDAGCIRADAAQMGRVIMNLCLNACDAMPSGGTLTIRTRNVEVTAQEARQFVGAKAGPAVCIQVADTGLGMTPEVRSRIFEPFFTTKPPGQGTGLGLSMVLGIVQQHRGWLDCWSEPGRGSVFTVWLPRDDSPSVTMPSLSPVATSAIRGSETILVVDDEPVVRMLARTILQRLGYTVLEASDGPDAVHLFQKEHHRITLVLLDYTMPGMSGQEVLEELTRIDPQVRVLFSSGYSTSPPAEQLSGNVLGFLGKPYRPEQLGKAVRQALDREFSNASATVKPNGQPASRVGSATS
ncbi:MAG: PAS domain S-box protein [Gemmatales bacterium]|nr:PAS domain S-box protein [Gemmatales bacterium]MDW8386932.1 PAS domain S-box protein [Gemmatales bacterium]